MGRMDMSKTSKSKALRRIGNTLGPSDEFKRRGKWAVNQIYEALADSNRFSFDRLIVSGSMGKNTALDDTTDYDLVVFLNDIEPPFSKKLMRDIERCIRNLPGYQMVKIGKFSVQFQMWIGRHVHDFDLLPASNLTSKARLANLGGYGRDKVSEQALQVRRRLKRYNEQFYNVAYILSSSLAEQTVLFLKRRPKYIVDVIKLAKYWNKSLPNMGYISGRSAIIELIAVKAQSGLKPCSLLQRFIRFLKWMKCFSDLYITFGYHYQTSSIPKHILHQTPLIMDPCNPYNNLAYKMRREAIAKFQDYAEDTLCLIQDNNLDDVEELFKW